MHTASGGRAHGPPGGGVLRVRAAARWSDDEVAARLSSASTPRVLDRLGITGADGLEVLEAIPAALADPAVRSAITEVTDALRREAGLEAEIPDLDARKGDLNDLQQRVRPGQGLVAILAHVAGIDTVRSWHRARGLSAERSWRTLSDLGQQLRVHRRTFGELGHHTLRFSAKTWAGRLFWLGRLQFELVRDPSREDRRWVIDVHVPAKGPLDPAAVDSSFDAATAYFTEHFGDLGVGRPPADPPFGREFTCRSWLIGPEMGHGAGEGSNLDAFARRWHLEETFDASRDAAFFVFARRGPFDPWELPATTRLERNLRDRLLPDGAGWRGGRGRLVR